MMLLTFLFSVSWAYIYTGVIDLNIFYSVVFSLYAYNSDLYPSPLICALFPAAWQSQAALMWDCFAVSVETSVFPCSFSSSTLASRCCTSALRAINCLHHIWITQIYLTLSLKGLEKMTLKRRSSVQACALLTSLN